VARDIFQCEVAPGALQAHGPDGSLVQVDFKGIWPRREKKDQGHGKYGEGDTGKSGKHAKMPHIARAQIAPLYPPANVCDKLKDSQGNIPFGPLFAVFNRLSGRPPDGSAGGRFL
jgi:hypothetical protein